MAAARMCQCKELVESHDLVGLKKVIEDPNITCCLYPCHFQPGLHKRMRQYIIKNQSVVEQACMLGYFDIVELFLNNGCSANLPTSHGRLIHSVLLAIKSNRKLVESGAAQRLVHLLLTMDCDVNVKNYNGKSPLLLAAELADAGIMEELLDHCLDWQLTGDAQCYWQSPVHMVCMNGSVECLNLLLSRLHIADLYMGDLKNYTPMSCSLLVLKNNLVFHTDGRGEESLLRVQYSHIAIIELLIEASRTPVRLLKPDYTYFPINLQIIRLALEIANQYEIERNQYATRGASFGSSGFLNWQANYISSPDEEEERKIVSPYAELVRMLVHSCNIDSVLLKDIVPLRSKYPFIKSLLDEIEELVTKRSSPEHIRFCLMDAARQVIRVLASQCNTLGQLEQLPLPRKLIDFIKFTDF
uniref:SOCS box domain-containing protein n=1 Tax=Biomphalaria glabrata TaxID=6526 RepID=A0A2C9L5W6_BIOGL